MSNVRKVYPVETEQEDCAERADVRAMRAVGQHSGTGHGIMRASVPVMIRNSHGFTQMRMLTVERDYSVSLEDAKEKMARIRQYNPELLDIRGTFTQSV